MTMRNKFAAGKHSFDLEGHRFAPFQMEAGNIVDQLGSLLVMLFMFVMVMVFAAYSKSAMMRISIDNITKEYLYQMEQYGCLTTEMQAAMRQELRDIGVDYGTNGETISFEGTSNLGDHQATYGDRVTIVCTMTFPNPIYEVVSSEKKGNMLFTVAGIPRTISYTSKMSATSKW